MHRLRHPTGCSLVHSDFIGSQFPAVTGKLTPCNNSASLVTQVPCYNVNQTRCRNALAMYPVTDASNVVLFGIHDFQNIVKKRTHGDQTIN